MTTTNETEHDAQRDYLDGFRDGRAGAAYAQGRSTDYAKGFQAGEATCQGRTITRDFPAREARLNEGSSLSLPLALARRWPLAASVLAFFDEVDRRPCLRGFEPRFDGAPAEHSGTNPYSTLEGRLTASLAVSARELLECIPERA